MSTDNRYDVIVVGARCAGAPTAMLLARQGHRVMLVDRAVFPSDIMSTHFLWQRGLATLSRWGLLEQIKATDAPPIEEMLLDFGPVALRGAPPPVQGVRENYSIRRKILDALLVEAAAAAGVEVRERFLFEDLLWEDGRVVGLRGRSLASGQRCQERCQILIGADGMRSRVAHAVAAQTYGDVSSLTCSYYSYWSGVHMGGAEWYPRDGRIVLAAPTNEDLVYVAIQWPAAEFKEVRADIEGHFRASLEMIPEFAQRIAGGRREEPFVGTGDVPNYFRHSFGPGWALVGDAAWHKDPITGQGISDAWHDAELLGEALHAGLSGSRPMPLALGAYEEQRNCAAKPIMDFALFAAALQPVPEGMVDFYRAVDRQPEERSRVFGVLSGSVAMDDVLSIENIARVLGGSP